MIEQTIIFLKKNRKRMKTGDRVLIVLQVRGGADWAEAMIIGIEKNIKLVL